MFLVTTIHHFLKVAPEVGIAPTSPRLQQGANLSQLLEGGEIPSSKHQAPEKLQYPSSKNG